MDNHTHKKTKAWFKKLYIYILQTYFETGNWFIKYLILCIHSTLDVEFGKGEALYM